MYNNLLRAVFAPFVNIEDLPSPDELKLHPAFLILSILLTILSIIIYSWIDNLLYKYFDIDLGCVPLMIILVGSTLLALLITEENWFNINGIF